jgi:DNA-binding SARP family transcriptional activator
MRLHVLGPVLLHMGAADLPLPTRKLQALLLLLALEGPTRRERLAQWLWPDLPLPAARRNLRRELARLRDLGAAAALAGHGDLLALAPGLACDLPQRLAAGDGLDWPPLADGLDLPNGGELADWLQARRQQVAAQRLALLGRAADTHAAAGRSAEALQALHQLLMADPLNEPRLRQWVRLLAAAGRRDEALTAIRALRRQLLDQLGTEPAVETEALAAALQREGAPAVLAPPAGASLPEQFPLVGREQQWQALQQAAARNRCVRIVGEAGIGKTRLAREFAASLGAHALAQCRRSDAGVPYAAYARVLRRLAGQTLATAPLPPWVRLELAQLLPELGPAEPRSAAAEGRLRLVEACCHAWQALAAGSFDVVVLDDWHLADEASRSLLQVVADSQLDGPSEGVPLVLLVERPGPTTTTTTTDGHHAPASDRWPRLDLPPLDPQAVYQLVQRLSGARDPRQFASRLLRASGGNPFFLSETLRHWRSRRLLASGPDGVWQTPFDDATTDYAELPLPDSVRNAVLDRVQRQPPALQKLLQAAALATEPFTAAQLASSCGLSELAALEAIGQGIQAGLLRERDGGHAFEHDLVQAALEEALPDAERRLVHCRLALGAEAAGLDAAVVARHWERGGQPPRAVAHRIAAAEAAAALFADDDALAHWQAALDDGPTLAQRVHILGGRGQLLLRRDDQPALQDLLGALDAARDQAAALPGAAALSLQAAVQAAEILQQAQRNEAALARIQACLANPALAAHGTPALAALRAQALRVASRVLSRLGRGDEANAAVRDALDAGGLGPLEQGELHHALCYSAFLQGDADASLAHARRAQALWQAAGARRQAAQAQASIGRALDMLDQREAAWAALEAAWSQAGALRMLDLQRVVANNLANNRLHHGGPARAIEVIGQSRALSPHFSMAAMPVFYLNILAQAHAQLGRLGEALNLAEQSMAQATALGETLTLADCAGMLLDLMTQLDHHDGQQRLLAALADRPLDGLRYFQIKLCFPLAGRALRAGDCAGARRHLALLGELDALPQPPDRAWARLRHAQLALAEGDAATAQRWLQPLAGQPLYTDVQAQSCATRLAAELRLGPPSQQALALADEALTADAGGRVLPALSRLGLLQVRGDAAARLHDAAGAARLAAEAQALQQRLRDSLGAHAQAQPGLAAALADQRPRRG